MLLIVLLVLVYLIVIVLQVGVDFIDLFLFSAPKKINDISQEFPAFFEKAYI